MALGISASRRTMRAEHLRTTGTRASASTRLTALLLVCGAIAGPFYLIVGVAQALTRPGFDLTRDDLSLLSNGGLGWVQILNFILCGLLVIAGAVGIRRALPAGRGSAAGPLLLGLYGLGLIGAGFFIADPAYGFPPGTPAHAHAISGHGFLHFLCGGTGFLALIAACWVFARRFARAGQRSWSRFSLLTGGVFLLAFIGIAMGSGTSWSVLGFWVGILLAWSWISALALRLRSTAGPRPGSS